MIARPVIAKRILFYASLAVLISGLFPPWLYTCYVTGTSDNAGMRSEHSAGYCLILTPPPPENIGWQASGVKLDGERLLLEWICILATAGLIWGIAGNGDIRPAARKEFHDAVPLEGERFPKRDGNGHE